MMPVGGGRGMPAPRGRGTHATLPDWATYEVARGRGRSGFGVPRFMDQGRGGGIVGQKRRRETSGLEMCASPAIAGYTNEALDLLSLVVLQALWLLLVAGEVFGCTELVRYILARSSYDICREAVPVGEYDPIAPPLDERLKQVAALLEATAAERERLKLGRAITKIIAEARGGDANTTAAAGGEDTPSNATGAADNTAATGDTTAAAPEST